jgi:lipopolysaccharide transport protein LptA
MRTSSLLSIVFASTCLACSAHAAELPGNFQFGAGATVAFDLAELDLRNDMHVLTGNVHVVQGLTSIDAARATANALQTPRTRWTFDKDVHIKTADADLKSDSANAAFVNGKMASAVAKGTPAYFEQRRAGSEKSAERLVKGRAGTIDYDLAQGIVKLSDQVWFSYGGNEFRGDVIIYNIRDERVTVNPGGQNSGRVNITVAPKALDNKSPNKSTPKPALVRPVQKSGA